MSTHSTYRIGLVAGCVAVALAGQLPAEDPQAHPAPTSPPAQAHEAIDASLGLVRCDGTWFIELKLINSSADIVDVPRQPRGFSIRRLTPHHWSTGEAYSSAGVAKVSLLPNEGFAKRFPVGKDLSDGVYEIEVTMAVGQKRFEPKPVRAIVRDGRVASAGASERR
jgi:hypothetical protein